MAKQKTQTIEWVDPKTIEANPDNPRYITEDDMNQLVQSIKEFPEMLEKRPIVVDRSSGTMIALGGNQRTRASILAGMKMVPVIDASEWSDDQKKRFIIADNVNQGAWDWDMLANQWDSTDLNDWGLSVFHVDEQELDNFFNGEEGEGDGKPSVGKLVLNFSEEELEKVTQMLDEYDGSHEQALLHYLGLDG